jgi:general stress protein 26
MSDFEMACQRLDEQMGHDVLVSLATASENGVSVRVVDGYYKEGAVYVLTHTGSHKMQDIFKDPRVALCKDLLQAQGIGENLGNPRDERNRELTPELKRIFFIFYDRHVNEEDPGTCILKINLTEAVVFDDASKYMVDFRSRSAKRSPFHNDIVNPNL